MAATEQANSLSRQVFSKVADTIQSGRDRILRQGTRSRDSTAAVSEDASKGLETPKGAEPMKIDLSSWGIGGTEAPPPPLKSFDSQYQPLSKGAAWSFKTNDSFDPPLQHSAASGNDHSPPASFEESNSSIKAPEYSFTPTDDGEDYYYRAGTDRVHVHAGSTTCSTSASSPPSVIAGLDDTEDDRIRRMEEERLLCMAQAQEASQRAELLDMQIREARARMLTGNAPKPAEPAVSSTAPLQATNHQAPGLVDLSHQAMANAALFSCPPNPDMCYQMDCGGYSNAPVQMDVASLMPPFLQQMWQQGGRPQQGKKSSAAASRSGVAATTDRQVPDSEKTTLMLRNIPNNYTREELLELLNSLKDEHDVGIRGRYNFFYLPIDFGSNRGKGFAFINFVTHAEAVRAWAMLDNFNSWKGSSKKLLAVGWAKENFQGYDANIEYYRNNEVMHPNWDDCVRPLVFGENGEVVAFPDPTVRIPTPRRRRSKQ
eukprot:CAMPEP_0178442142 /NCGR_PEP_ID=MMETSP0689_2-20121128/37970_1 /TAXON_ID=160604 /ORGANISM="Amphidinium massartii, Strain CS-259" /LENGTH=485 /DNA_ID=CAMNT_0020065595 /DNA_START=23 /DNA_END=1480 /DNA_ORIENTATION=-